jgi:hypothetical protein
MDRVTFLLPVVSLAGALLACSSSDAQGAQDADASADAVADVAAHDGSAQDGSQHDASDAQPDTPASATCGTCPASAPVCYHVNAHDGSHIVSAECIPMPAACSATPTCDCARQAIAASWSADSGADAGLPGCPGNGLLYCDGTEGPLTIRCNPP